MATAHSLSLVEQRLGDQPVALDNDWSDRHRAFHMATYSACQSPLLIELVELLFDSSERYRRYSASHRKGHRGKHDEHNRILKSVLSRDTATAVSLLNKHIVGTQNMVSQALLQLAAKGA